MMVVHKLTSPRLLSQVQGVVYQAQGGSIIAANPSAERILGLTVDQMKGRTSIDPRWKSIHEDGSDYPGETHPAMVALSLDRQALAVMHGAFRETNIQTFLHGITTGRQSVVPLADANLPVATTTPWDGKDGQPIEEADDFDLDAFLNDEM